MRINKFVAQASGLSRRAADSAIEQGRVTVNSAVPTPGAEVSDKDKVRLDGKVLTAAHPLLLLILNKPAGFVVSRSGQGSRTIYDILPPKYHHLKPVGRLDKDSSGLLLLTNNGELANQLTHPKYEKQKVYEVGLDKPLEARDKQALEAGIKVEDYVSQLKLSGLGNRWTVELHLGKNRQIRKTFAALGYQVIRLHRTRFGGYELGSLAPGTFQVIEEK